MATRSCLLLICQPLAWITFPSQGEPPRYLQAGWLVASSLDPPLRAICGIGWLVGKACSNSVVPWGDLSSGALPGAALVWPREKTRGVHSMPQKRNTRNAVTQ